MVLQRDKKYKAQRGAQNLSIIPIVKKKTQGKDGTKIMQYT